MAKFQVDFKADTAPAVRSINTLQEAISEVAKDFNDAEIGSKKFVGTASKLSQLTSGLKAARGAVVDIDKAYDNLNKAIEANFAVHTKAANEASKYHKSLLQLATNSAKEEDRLRNKNFRAEVDDFDRRLKLAATASKKMAAQQRAIMEFRSGMGAKGAIPNIASPIKGTVQQFGSPASFDALNASLKIAIAEGRQIDAEIRKAAASRAQAIAEFRSGMGAKGAIPAIASPIRGSAQQFGSPASFDALNASLKTAIAEGRQIDAEIRKAAASRAQAIAEFRMDMGAKGAIPAIASPIRGGIKYGPAYGSAGSPDFLEAQKKAFQPQSLAAYEAKLKDLQREARLIRPDDNRWQQLNKEILQAQKGIEKINKMQRLGPSARQRVGAAGGAFLYGGGLGGGAGSAIGGIAGGLAGGVPGAFAGAAAGQLIDNLTTMTAAMTNQAAVISKLQMGLATVSNSLTDFALATREVENIANRLQLPLEIVYRKFTQLRASTIALGLDTKTTGQIFEGTSAAVLKSGGSLDDVGGAMRAVAQVFSKGKLMAEELRGQLGERLPGAVVEFAQSSGRSLQELDAAFDNNSITLGEFVTFLRKKAKESGDFVDEMGERSEYAGARMAKAFEKMQLNIGMSLQPTGAAIQDFITRSINGFDLLIRKAIEFKLIQPGADFYVGQALAGRNGGIAGLENQLLAAAAAETNARDLALKGGLGFLVDLLPEVKATSKEVKDLEEALIKIRNLEKLTKKRKVEQENEDNKRKKDQTAEFMLGAIERKEEAILAAKKQREEEIAEIRKQAVVEAKRIEEEIAKQRLMREREIAGLKRELAGVQTDVDFELTAVSVASTGGDPEAVRIQQQISEAARRRDEEKIAVEQKILDEQTERGKALEQLKITTSSAINEANTRYAKAIGEAQQGYARAVAKIISEGTGKAGERLAAAAKLAAAYINQATAKQAFTAATGASVVQMGSNYVVGETEFTAKELLNAARQTSLTAATSAKDFIVATQAIKSAEQVLNQFATSVSSGRNFTANLSVSITDLTNRLSNGVKGLDKLALSFKNVSNALSDANFFKEFVGIGIGQAEGMIKTRKDLEDQSNQMTEIFNFRKLGMKPNEAEQIFSITLQYEEALRRLGNAYAAASAQATPGQEMELDTTYQSLVDSIEAAYIGAIQFSDAINNIPVKIQLETSIQDIKDELNNLLDPVNQIRNAAGAVGDSFGTAFKGVITGSMTAKEALAGFFQSVAGYFADMVAKMIAEYLKMQLIEGITNLIQMLSPGFNTSIAPGPVAKSAGVKFSPAKMGPAFANGGIAYGGFTAFANGGIVTGPTLGLVGEGRYNEAVIPLPDGKSVPVDLGGAMGNQITSNIVVNVSSDGKTSSSGAGADSAGLGRKLEGAVKQVILTELSPGGILAGRR